MKDDAPRPAPRGVRDAIVHAAVVATAWAVGQYATHVLLTMSVFALPELIQMVRWSVVMGIAAAVAAHRRPGCSRARAAFECAAIALIAWNVAVGLWLGSEVADAMTGFALRGSVSPFAPDEALEWYANAARSPFTYVRIASLAVGLFLASSRRGTRWEGLALMGPTVLAAWYLPNLMSIPIVAIALPLLTRVVDRLRASRGS